ncbi:hypothetical protein PTKIN_Ptkin11bG0195900 [Pterospermum kingtungense]
MDNQFQFFPLCFTFLVFIFMVFKLWMISKIKDSPENLPPSPWKLPLIGQMDLFIFSLSHHLLRELAKKHGPLMHLKLGELSAIVVSSPETAKRVLKAHDINFSNRPFLLLARIILDNFTDIAYAPYGDYWRLLRKICTGKKAKLERLHQVADEVLENIIEEHRDSNANRRTGEDVITDDLVDVLLNLRDHGGLEFPLTDDNIKAVILDMLQAGTETSTTTIEWAMSELMKMEKAETEETLRLHPHLPLLLPRESVERCEINGYEIPAKSKVIVNAWAIGRDPKYWNEAERFSPDRFMDSSIDYKGTYSEYVPFGAGRRMRPGISFGMAIVELTLAHLL